MLSFRPYLYFSRFFCANSIFLFSSPVRFVDFVSPLMGILTVLTNKLATSSFSSPITSRFFGWSSVVSLLWVFLIPVWTLVAVRGRYFANVPDTLSIGLLYSAPTASSFEKSRYLLTCLLGLMDNFESIYKFVELRTSMESSIFWVRLIVLATFLLVADSFLTPYSLEIAFFVGISRVLDWLPV